MPAALCSAPLPLLRGRQAPSVFNHGWQEDERMVSKLALT